MLLAASDPGVPVRAKSEEEKSPDVILLEKIVAISTINNEIIHRIAESASKTNEKVPFPIPRLSRFSCMNSFPSRGSNADICR